METTLKIFNNSLACDTPMTQIIGLDTERPIPVYRKPYRQDLNDQRHSVNRYITKSHLNIRAYNKTMYNPQITYFYESIICLF